MLGLFWSGVGNGEELPGGPRADGCKHRAISGARDWRVTTHGHREQGWNCNSLRDINSIVELFYILIAESHRDLNCFFILPLSGPGEIITPHIVPLTTKKTRN